MRISAAAHGALEVCTDAYSTNTINRPAEPPMASHDFAHDCHICRHLHLDGNGPLNVDAIELPLASHAIGLLPSIHPQHRNFQCLSCHGLRTISPSHAIYLSGRHDPHLPLGLRPRVQQNDLLLHDPSRPWCWAGNSGGLPSISARDPPHYLRGVLGLHQNRRHKPPHDRPSFALTNRTPPSPFASRCHPMHGIRIRHRRVAYSSQIQPA